MLTSNELAFEIRSNQVTVKSTAHFAVERHHKYSAESYLKKSEFEECVTRIFTSQQKTPLKARFQMNGIILANYRKLVSRVSDSG